MVVLGKCLLCVRIWCCLGDWDLIGEMVEWFKVLVLKIGEGLNFLWV